LKLLLLGDQLVKRAFEKLGDVAGRYGMA